ncbi:MAG: L-threonylcarbamoyladenylate synthase [Acidimicrobiaceae bacterium]|nr:L-threonylcarbamoyladenylate synthase [Acidimicrobiaceae bacterium]
MIVDPLTAAAALRDGSVVALPTDTVYGLAADAAQPDAVERLFELKERPHDVQVPVLVADVPQARGLAVIASSAVEGLLERFWPGPLTVVLHRLDGSGTIGLRCPEHAVVRDLCRRVGPLATTSANRHGEPPVTTAAGVLDLFEGAVAVVDGGTCAGTPSTVVDCTGPEPLLLRDGAVPFAVIADLFHSTP